MLSGLWTLALYVNPSTSIAQALLPFYSATSPLQGTKKARDSILKLITGMHDDVSPLRFRSAKKLDGTPDMYYKAAPGWTNLTGGSRPVVSCSPYKIASMLIEACKCVPFVKEVTIMLMDVNGTAIMITLEELGARNIVVQPVPIMDESATTSTATADKLRELEAARDEALTLTLTLTLTLSLTLTLTLTLTLSLALAISLTLALALTLALTLTPTLSNQARREATHNATKAHQLQEQVQVQAKQNEELSDKVNKLQLQMKELMQAKKVVAAETPEPAPKRARRLCEN